MRGYPQLILPDEVIGYLDLIVPPDPQSASEVRQHAGYVFRAWGLRPEETGTAQLLAGELLANAVTFTAHLVTGDPWEAGAISLSVRYHPGAVVIEVRDTDPAPPVLAEAGPDAESGRGLMLVAALSKEWGHYPLPSGGRPCTASSAQSMSRRWIRCPLPGRTRLPWWEWMATGSRSRLAMTWGRSPPGEITG